MKKMKLRKAIFLIFIALFVSFSYASIELTTKEDKEIRSGEFIEYILEVKNRDGNPIEGNYSLELLNLSHNKKVNLIPRKSFYYFIDGKININFQLFDEGSNEILINVNKGKIKERKHVKVFASQQPYSPLEVDDLSYSYLESLMPLKKGENRIRIYLKDSYGNKITEGNYNFKVYSEIANFDGRIDEHYYLQEKQIRNKEKITVTEEIIDGKDYVEMLLKIPNNMDKNDGFLLKFYLEDGSKLNPSLSYYSKEDIDYTNIGNIGFEKKLILQINNNKAEMNNFTVFIDAKPLLINDKTMVPIRIVSDFLDINSEWLSDEKAVLLSGKNKKLFLKIGERGSIIINNRTYVPLRYIAENFDAFVIWDGEEKKITITK